MVIKQEERLYSPRSFVDLSLAHSLTHSPCVQVRLFRNILTMTFSSLKQAPVRRTVSSRVLNQPGGEDRAMEYLFKVTSLLSSGNLYPCQSPRSLGRLGEDAEEDEDEDRVRALNRIRTHIQ